MAKSKQVNLRFDPLLYDRIRERSDEVGISVNEWFARAAIHALAARNPVTTTTTVRYTL